MKTESYLARVEQILSGNSIRIACLIECPALNAKFLIEAKIKLIGIECMPDKGKPSRDYMEREILGKEVTMKTSGGRDRHNRLLALIIYKDRNINSELVEKGLCYRIE